MTILAAIRNINCHHPRKRMTQYTLAFEMICSYGDYWVPRFRGA